MNILLLSMVRVSMKVGLVMLGIILGNVVMDLKTSTNQKELMDGDAINVISICVVNAYKFQVALKKRSNLRKSY